MFNIGPAEVLIILIVALLVLGPKKLPEAARQMGKAMTEFRRVTSGLQDEVRGVLDEHMAEPAPIDPAVLPPAVTERPGETNGSNGDGITLPTPVPEATDYTVPAATDYTVPPARDDTVPPARDDTVSDQRPASAEQPPLSPG